MKTKKIVLLACCLMMAGLSINATDKKDEAENKEPAALTQARKAYQAQVNSVLDPIKKKYLAQLEDLKKQLGGKGDLEGAGAVQREMEKLSINRKTNEIGKEWTVVFSSNNPEKWNKEKVKKDAPEDMRYLRIKRIDTGDYVIIPLEKNKLTADLEINSRYGWYGSGTFICNAYHLGIADLKKGVVRGTMCIDPYASPERDHPGWGFGHKAYINDKQCYAWDGEEIKKTVFEISVRTSELAPEEQEKLLK